VLLVIVGPAGIEIAASDDADSQQTVRCPRIRKDMRKETIARLAG
jgi:hypothetical protein